MKITIDWGSRSRALRAQLKQSARSAGTSFWLMPSASPVKLGVVTAGALGSWETAATTDIPVALDATSQSVSGEVLQGATLVRLDFDLRATVGGATGTVLSFRQLFTVAQPTSGPSELGVLLPAQFWFEARILEPSPLAPKFKVLGWPGSPRRVGLHPLLKVEVGRVLVNAEFVDVTELWWAVRKDQWGWYLNKDLGGRQEYLRVLAWTGGGDPMIWFAVIPDAAASSELKAPSSSAGGAEPPPADIVFYRPPPGVNSFTYRADEKGFLDTKHDDTTMYILARYLLSPIPAHRFAAIRQARKVKSPELLADQIQPVETTPKIKPPDPMDIDIESGHGFRAKFRPVGLEAAVNRARLAGVLFLPLAAGDHDHPYDGAQLKDLKTIVRSALTVLWNGHAFGILAGSSPHFHGRELWLAGHSSGNLSLWLGLKNNAADVARVISSDATPKSTNLALGLPILKAASSERKKAGRKLDVFAITTPNMTGQADTGLTDPIDRDLRKTLADVTVLPLFDRRSSYWKLPPTEASNAYLRYLLANWSDDLLSASAKTPGKWFFLFFHELAMFGGDLAPAPPPTPSVEAAPPLPVLPQGMAQPQPSQAAPGQGGQKSPPSQGAPPGSQPPGASLAAPGMGVVVKTFFETALGLPRPRPAPS